MKILENKYSEKINKNSMSGITLIALVITIIVLLILTGVALASVLGENGIINRAENAAKTSKINSAKEQIELALLATQMDRMKNKQPFDLRYVKENIGKELNRLEIIGTHGSPIDRVYVKYDDEQFMIDEEGNVIHIGDVELNTVPDLEVIPDEVKTGVEKVVLNLNSDVELGEITKIVIKSGGTVIKELTGQSGTYEVTENGEYECTVVTDKGTEINKTVVIDNIKEDGFDLTKLTTGTDGGHKCIYKTIYNETKHWSECIFCGKKESELGHTYTTTWSLGYESCHYSNIYTNICDCGYKEMGNKPCVWDGESYETVANFHIHRKVCINCKVFMGEKKEYYIGTYGKGELYIDEGNVPCYTSENVRLTCQNRGTCNICKYNYQTSSHGLEVNEKNVIKCNNCNTEFGTFEYIATNNGSVPSTYTFTSNLSLKNGATLNTNLGGIRNVGAFDPSTQTIKLDSINADRTEATITKTITFKNTWKTSYTVYVTSILDIDGISYTVQSGNKDIFPDLEKPEITNIQQQDLELVDGWTTSKKITISGTENYGDSVTLTVKDDSGETVYTGSTVVTNNSYSLSFIPDLEADGKGRIFNVIALDSCGNQSETTFTVQKVDSKKPTISSITELGNSWSKRKNLSLEIIDEGVGNVEIAFNDTTLYEKLTEIDNKFNKNYKFVGDLYTEIEASIYIKDGLGNLLTKTIKIGKVDNTSPTIKDVFQVKNGSTTVITIDANDENETLKAIGSGIVGYAIIPSQEIPSEIVYQTGNVFNINEPGTYYVWVKDAAGNLVRWDKEIEIQ